jgi:hypothetical protein
MIEPCIILTDDQAEDWGILGMPIIPGMQVAAFITENMAKQKAHEIGCSFARINFGLIVWGWE